MDRRTRSLEPTKQPSSAVSSSSQIFRTAQGDIRPPLKGRVIVLDVEDVRSREQAKKSIIALGGEIGDLLGDTKPPNLILSDHPAARTIEVERSMVGCSKRFTVEFLRKLPLMLRDAISNNIKVRSFETFQKQLGEFRARTGIGKTKINSIAKAKSMNKSASVTSTQSVPLVKPYARIDFPGSKFACLYKHYRIGTAGTHLYTGKDYGQSLFHKATPEQQIRREKELNGDDDETLHEVKKPVKNRVNKSGYCELCSRQCDDINQHLDSREHLAVVKRPGLFDEVDSLMGSTVDHIVCPGYHKMDICTPPSLPSPPLPQKRDFLNQVEVARELSRQELMASTDRKRMQAGKFPSRKRTAAHQ